MPTVFLCSGIIASEQPFWWSLPNFDPGELKRVSNAVRAAEVERALADRNVPRQALSKAEIRALGDAFAFGAHTSTHPILPMCTDEEAEHEIRVSRTEVEQLTGRPCEHFAYPNGDFGPRELELVRAAGYRSSRTTIAGWVTSATDAYRLPILPMPDDATANRALSQVAIATFRPELLNRNGRLAARDRDLPSCSRGRVRPARFISRLGRFVDARVGFDLKSARDASVAATRETVGHATRVTRIPAVAKRFGSPRRAGILLYHAPKPEVFASHLEYLAPRHPFVPYADIARAASTGDWSSLPPTLSRGDVRRRPCEQRPALPLLEAHGITPTIFSAPRSSVRRGASGRKPDGLEPKERDRLMDAPDEERLETLGAALGLDAGDGARRASADADARGDPHAREPRGLSGPYADSPCPDDVSGRQGVVGDRRLAGRRRPPGGRAVPRLRLPEREVWEAGARARDTRRLSLCAHDVDGLERPVDGSVPAPDSRHAGRRLGRLGRGSEHRDQRPTRSDVHDLRPAWTVGACTLEPVAYGETMSDLLVVVGARPNFMKAASVLTAATRRRPEHVTRPHGPALRPCALADLLRGAGARRSRTSRSESAPAPTRRRRPGS